METISVHSWGLDWAWGVPLIILSILIHVVGLKYIGDSVVNLQSRLKLRSSAGGVNVAVVGAMALLMIMLHSSEVMAWAIAYRILDALPDAKTSMLYSLGAMTTYGHAEIFLRPKWQLLGAMEALDGMFLFGLTTAFMFAIFQSIGAFERHRRA